MLHQLAEPPVPAERRGRSKVRTDAEMNRKLYNVGGFSMKVGKNVKLLLLFWSLVEKKEPGLMTGYTNLQLGSCSGSSRACH